jgi:hypothetical protein
MPPVTLSLLLAAAGAAVAAAQTPCVGAYSLCANGACALTPEACGACPAGQYVCPLSATCAATPAAVAGCAGSAATHFDPTLTIEARLDYIFAQSLSLAELISQMTDNATQIPRLAIPAYVWLNDDQHGVKQPDATAFPNGNAFGASWSAPLLERVGLALGTEARGVFNSLLDKSAQTGGSGWPGTLRNGATLTAYAPNVNLVHGASDGERRVCAACCPRSRAPPAPLIARRPTVGAGARGHVRGPDAHRHARRRLRQRHAELERAGRGADGPAADGRLLQALRRLQRGEDPDGQDAV